MKVEVKAVPQVNLVLTEDEAVWLLAAIGSDKTFYGNSLIYHKNLQAVLKEALVQAEATREVLS